MNMKGCDCIMKKIINIAVVAMLIAMMIPCTVMAQDKVSKEVAGNYFEAGAYATVSSVKARDVFSAGQAAIVESSSAKGNIFAAGNNVNVSDSSAGADIFAAGQTVTISNSDIDGNVFTAGQSIVVHDTDANGIVVAAADIKVIECKAEDIVISGAEVVFDSVASGNVVISGDKVTIGDNAKIKGSLTVSSSNEPVISENAVINQYDYNKIEESDTEVKADKLSIVAKAIHKIVTRAYWIPAAALIALVLAFLFGQNLNEAGQMIKNHPAQMILTGGIAWAVTPVIAIVVCVTLIGAPLGGMLALAYFFLILLGLPFAGASVGRIVMPKLHPILASLIGVAVLEAVRIVPVVGTTVAVAADIYLIGYVCVSIYNNIPKKAKAVVVAEAVAIEDKETTVTEVSVPEEA